jgi:predicted dehydrogenase
LADFSRRLMRFALLGNHPDGLDMAVCLAASGRHQIVTVTSSSLDAELLGRLGDNVRRVGDLEEVLADPAVEAVIVASGHANRAAHLRRALQSERHVLCVHPPDASADLAYEAAMIRQDTGRVLMPLLGEAFHPGIHRLRELWKSGTAILGEISLIELEHHGRGAVLTVAGMRDDRPSFPGWHILRTLSGEIAEISAFADQEDLSVNQLVLVCGRFDTNELFRMSMVPRQSQPMWRLNLFGTAGRAELHFPLGDPGPAFLIWRDGDGQAHEEAWDAWDPWPLLVVQFEAAIDSFNKNAVKRAGVTWQDTIRCLELDDAARRSVERRRVSGMEYQEASEEVGFKGTMTLVGCALIWVILLLFIVSPWLPWLRWVIVPVIALFLVLQLFRWIIPGPREDNGGGSEGSKTGA